VLLPSSFPADQACIEKAGFSVYATDYGWYASVREPVEGVELRYEEYVAKALEVLELDRAYELSLSGDTLMSDYDLACLKEAFANFDFSVMERWEKELLCEMKIIIRWATTNQNSR
jgi:hypothetical protein